MVVAPVWSTACRDWEERIVARRSLVPFDPLFPDEAEAGLDIFRNLTIVDAPGSPSFADCSPDWVFDLPRHLFGSYDAATGNRLIRYFFLGVAKKNIKSTLAAGTMLTALVRNWRRSGEYYILAPTKEIADNSFAPARDMIRADNKLHALVRVQENFRSLTHRETGAFVKVVAADSETVGGKKTIGLFIDELWLFGKKAGADAMIREAQGGLASRPEGFVIYATTQSDFAPTGVHAQKLEQFRAIRDGKVHDPRSLPIIYEFPKEMIDSGAYIEPENYYIPNPNIGHSVDAQYLIDERATAERAGKASLINFEAKHLNVQVGMALRADSWAGALVWDRGAEETLTLDVILDRSEVVTVGIDGGGLDDLLGVAIVGREKDTKRRLAWAHALISDIGMERRRANVEQYDQFETDGDLTKFVYEKPKPEEPGAKPENVVPISAVADLKRKLAELPLNIRFVVELVKRIKDKGLLAQVGVDAAGIGAIVDALALIGVTQDTDNLDAVRQGISLMGAIKTVETKLADYSFVYVPSRLLTWCVGNLRVIPTRTAMMVARDEAGFGKVDPLMALFNAEHLMSLNPADSRSVYERRGLLRV